MDADTLRRMFPGASASTLAANAAAVNVGAKQGGSALWLETDREPANAFIGTEKLLHRDFATDMERRGCHVVHARTDRESTIAAGLPDFHVMFTGADGICRGAACEFKRTGGSCSPKQREVIAAMRKKGVPVIVAWTLKDAIEFMKKHLLC